ncbi:MAG: hypothetical protein ACRDO7_02570 [Nocardioidaceae bacterium]
MNEIHILHVYLRARTTLARRDDDGVSAVEWAIIVSLGVGIAIAVAFILMRKAQQTANQTPTN